MAREHEQFPAARQKLQSKSATQAALLHWQFLVKGDCWRLELKQTH